MRGTNARMPWTTPKRFTPRIHSQSRSGTCHIGPPMPMPALLHTTCTLPNASNVRRANSSTCAALETSVRTAMASALPLAIASRTSPSGLSSTSASTTFMPSRAKRSANARPIPLAAPVTTATLPLKSFMEREFEQEHGKPGRIFCRDRPKMINGCAVILRKRSDRRTPPKTRSSDANGVLPPTAQDDSNEWHLARAVLELRHRVTQARDALEETRARDRREAEARPRGEAV